jgi:hypothetical protein
VSPLIRCSGSTTPTSTGFGGTGTTARKATIQKPAAHRPRRAHGPMVIHRC